MEKKILITGDRPTGKLHLGHYFGSLQNRVKMQYDYDTYILIADVQALTDNFNNPDKVKASVKELTLDYLAAGIDPKQSHIYIQSMTHPNSLSYINKAYICSTGLFHIIKPMTVLVITIYLTTIKTFWWTLFKMKR